MRSGKAQLQARLVALDLRDVAFMDCSGVHMIVDATLHIRRTGRRLVLLRGPPSVDRVFAQTEGTDEQEAGRARRRFIEESGNGSV